MTQIGSIIRDGIWRQNSGLVLLLGLCPLLAVTTTLAYGLGLGVATLLVMALSNTIISTLRGITAPYVRILVYVLVIAGLVTAIDILMHAWFFDMHRSLGLFVPLIVTNCAIIARAEAFASRNSVHRAMIDGIAHGLGFALVLALLGFFRELVGAGTLFADMEFLFGAHAAAWEIKLHPGFLLAILPPGAFIMLALMVATHRAIDQKLSRKGEITQPTLSSLPPIQE